MGKAKDNGDKIYCKYNLYYENWSFAFTSFCSAVGVAFIAIYLLCGLSDVLDGYIARRTHTESTLGSRLDSDADFVMTAVVLVVLYPIVAPSTGVWLWVAVIAAVRFTSIVVVWAKFGKQAMLHTYANKTTGFLLFWFPLSLAIFMPEISIIIL